MHLRLLAERTGLRGELPAALARPGFVPLHDRGQVMVDLAVAITLGATCIRAIRCWNTNARCSVIDSDGTLIPAPSEKEGAHGVGIPDGPAQQMPCHLLPDFAARALAYARRGRRRRPLIPSRHV
ncbi:hypothetical protein [Streptomyces sp. FL07-04A]|uniref:hypothetical protein n=1 Tax=Streptomyces sp. FL07-04A TaxID=3028658 RepID=UPI0029A7CC7E|nr:hypothetical protein [Streptomyces sp. FL07-04A]MDX3580058.1 hypothetical protein [Streptomyces sp. FL07-04A]